MTIEAVSMAGGADHKVEAVEEVNLSGDGPFLFVCEHASNRIPEKYENLGLDEEARLSHVAWDPGARAVALKLSKAFRSPLIASRVSRLVYDCNRPPESKGAMPAKSELYDIPGNHDLSDAARDARTRTVYRPFQEAIRRTIEDRLARDLPVVIVTVHSFTPVYYGKPRAVEIGIIHDEDTRAADAMLSKSADATERVVLRNAPYSAADGVAHTLQVFGTANDLANVMIEIRNDLLQDDDGIDEIVAALDVMLESAATALGIAPRGEGADA